MSKRLTFREPVDDNLMCDICQDVFLNPVTRCPYVSRTHTLLDVIHVSLLYLLLPFFLF